MIHKLMLALSIAVCLMSFLSITQQSEAASTYTVTIPATLDIHESGWHELSEGITASGSLDNGKILVITASSDNGFKFVKSGDNTQTVSYDFRASSSDTTPITTWKFDTLSTNSTMQTAGIFVEDYSDKPGGTYTETVIFTAEIADGIVDISTLKADYTAQDGETLTGTLNGSIQPYKITIAAGATVTLDSVDITGTNKTDYKWAGITCVGNATIILSGNNTVRGFHENYPGIFISQNSTLTISGDGKLTASSNGWSAGIGGGYEIAGGNIIIAGGNIIASGGRDAAGIGCGRAGSCGSIDITGGTVNAKGGENAPGIGSGNKGSCGSITITSGVNSVTATKGNGAPYSIGKGYDGTSSCGTITIGGTVYPNGITASTYTYITSKTGAVTLTNGTTLAGTGGSNTHITVAAGATITLDSVDITSISNNESHKWAGISCAGDATIILSGDNKVKGGHGYYPGIHIASGDILTIKGDGSLTASSNGYGAGIGGGFMIACGNIVIQGGTITATGGQYVAGIGGGNVSSCGTITISGGTITATGGDYAAGIGGGLGTTRTISSCGNITITTGVTKVTATAGGGSWVTTQHSIGAGNNGSCGTVTIGCTLDSSGNPVGGTTGQITTNPYTYQPGAN